MGIEQYDPYTTTNRQEVISQELGYIEDEADYFCEGNSVLYVNHVIQAINELVEYYGEDSIWPEAKQTFLEKSGVEVSV